MSRLLARPEDSLGDEQLVERKAFRDTAVIRNEAMLATFGDVIGMALIGTPLGFL
jgi:hypothetical protein